MQQRRHEAQVCYVAAAIVGSAAIAGGTSLIAAGKAEGAAKNATAAQLQMYNQTRSDLAPYLSTGTSALSQLAKLWGLGPGGTGIPDMAAMTSALEGTPGYQFGRDQGIKGLDASGASRGLLLSGAQLEDAQKFGTDYAMQQAWNPYVSQLNQFATLGENAGAQVGNAGVQTGRGIADSTLAGGQAAANGIAGVGNAIQSGYQMWQQAGQPGFGATKSPLAGYANDWSSPDGTAWGQPGTAAPPIFG